MQYDFTKAIARAKAKQEKQCYLNIQSQEQEYSKEIEHEHRYFLKCDSFSMGKYHRECECGKKLAITKYKIEI